MHYEHDDRGGYSGGSSRGGNKRSWEERYDYDDVEGRGHGGKHTRFY